MPTLNSDQDYQSQCQLPLINDLIAQHWTNGWIKYKTLESILPTQNKVQLKRQVIYVKEV